MATAVEAPTPVADVGFTILSDPQDAVIDIVFVHGLQGHPQNTWTYESKSTRKASKSDQARTSSPFRIFPKRKRPEPRASEDVGIEQSDGNGEEAARGKDVFWPRDLLKDDFPRARIMTFGYDTKITRGYYAAHQGNIFSHARDLLYGLDAKRRKVAERKLVFIAHSLGGILVKELLRRSEVDSEAKINKIFTSTIGIFFFGTPHRGSKDWASFVKGVAGVAGRLLGVDTNDQVIRALLPTGPELELCRESFTSQWVKRGNSLTVRTFQESKGLTGVRFGGSSHLIVPPDSSSLDHPNQHARTIDADHKEMVRFSGKDDRAYEMVKEDIQELIDNSLAAKETGEAAGKGARPSSYYLPFPRNRRFVGRSDELEKLRRKLFVIQECQKMAVVGLGGIGKTQVALEFAQSVKEKMPEYSIFWVPALSLESFEQACAEIVRILQIRCAAENKDVKDLLRQHLSCKTAGKWLLIVDNADDMDVLFGAASSKGIIDYLPESEDGLTLFTSRRQEVAQSLVGGDVVELGKLSEEEAIAFVRESLSWKDLGQDKAITTLLTELAYLPLAIAQAVAYINTNKGTTITAYLRLLKNTDEDIVSLMSREFRDSTRYRQSANAVATTWVVSFNQILKENATAADLLGFMSCIEWKAIPRSILPKVQPEARMDNAIGTICSYSFAIRRVNEEVYDMHRLVHLATRIWLDRNGRGLETRKKAIEHVAKVFPSNDWENREVWGEYLPHALRVFMIEHEEGVKDQSMLLQKVLRCLHDEQVNAVKLLEHMFAVREKVLAKEYPRRLTLQDALSQANEVQERLEKAGKLLEHILAVKKKFLALEYPNPPDVVSTSSWKGV